ncbi:MAG: hypothetical protein N0C84_18040 [Candidatus Thiodiazotropha taylori]|uniref:Uncharacterized protein n=1 Tax=Candidatus Thiodiazotropha taylori TaxID=2792791 RepID=A0A9E4T747_9GAMM|nr:hypothetical protein [Candidatus Thiodiazotropha taylori]MCW4258369.1 hypothetical protein [Candidatus Thiodiazotropha taylori]
MLLSATVLTDQLVLAAICSVRVDAGVRILLFSRSLVAENSAGGLQLETTYLDQSILN